MDRARELGLVCFSSPFDETAVDFLEELGAPAYKIASFENNHLPPIEKAAATGKILIISTGLSSLRELDDAVPTARDAGCTQLALFKCTSTYPASPENTNIRTSPHLRELFACEVGLSDHTMEVGVAVASVGLGATVLEKHFTLAMADGGVDSTFSFPFEQAKLNSLTDETRRAWQALGEVCYGPTEAEQKSMVFRMSLYVSKDISKGEILSEENMRIVRPGNVLPPRFYKYFIGKVAQSDFEMGPPMEW